MQELERLAPDAGVFKLVGPLLVRQDLVEARANVGKRLDFIRHERRAWLRLACGSRLRRSLVPRRQRRSSHVSPRACSSSDRLSTQINNLEAKLPVMQKEVRNETPEGKRRRRSMRHLTQTLRSQLVRLQTAMQAAPAP